MFKKSFYFTLVLFLVSLNGLYARGGSQSVLYSSDEKMADARMERIVSAIRNNEKESLKSLFSKKALVEANEIDRKIDHFFDFIKGNIVFYERKSGSGSESIEYGKRSFLIRYSIYIVTDEDDYSLYVMDYCIDTINPDNEGMYTLELRSSPINYTRETVRERLRPGIIFYE